MRRLVYLTGAAVAVAMTALAFVPTAAASAKEPLCRRAPELTQLPPEAAPQQQQQGGGREYDAMEAPPPPPPPSPPPPPKYLPSVPPAVVMAPSAPTTASPVTVISEESIATTGSRTAKGKPPSASRTEDSIAPTVAPPPPPPAMAERESEPGESAYIERSPAPPAGLLTAGDHDDLLNPMLYARYVARAVKNLGQQIAGLPRVDTRRVLTISVEDSSGRAAPFVPVTLTCADGNHLTLSTLSDGRVAFFPALDRLGDKVMVEAAGVRRAIAIDPASGGQQQELVIGGAARPVRKFDLMIALDSTGSMGDEIEFLKSELHSILGDIQHAYPDLDMRVGLVAYRDLGDDYVTRTDRFTPDFNVIQRSLQRTRGEGGGDMPEAMDQALIRAVGQDWRPDAVKTLLLVADAPPHDDLQGRAYAAAQAARARRIQIVPVAASGVDDRAEYFMRAVAAATQSRYIFLTDDSGIGNAHKEPDVDCYLVTQLAGEIRRVLASQISGQRLEPFPGEVIRAVGEYDHGKCVLPKNFSVQ
ncbi:MAG: vWA domain-containing protein [Sphingomicrobium sp.]